MLHPRRTFAAILPLIAGATVLHADWPNFRGPNYDGIAASANLKVDWSTPIPLVWERDIGDGFSSFAVVDGRLYTGGTNDNQQTLYCLDANTGKPLWERVIGPHYFDAQGGNGPRATPTVADGRVYILGGHGNLRCFDAATGNEIWSNKYDYEPQWGYSGSVLVDGDLAIVSVGKDAGALLALDKNTGKTVWKCGEDPAGYATPYPFTFNNKRYICGFTGKSALIADAQSGKLVWRLPWETAWDVNAAAPIFHDGYLLLSSGYGHGAILVKLKPAGDKLTHDVVWEGKNLRNKFQSCILQDGYIYTSDEKELKCVDFRTSDIKWSRKREKHGTLVLADRHLFVLTEEGNLLIAPATPEELTVLTDAKILSGRCWTVPVIDGGKLYARNLDRLVCFDLSPAGRSKDSR